MFMKLTIKVVAFFLGHPVLSEAICRRNVKKIQPLQMNSNTCWSLKFYKSPWHSATKPEHLYEKHDLIVLLG